MKTLHDLFYQAGGYSAEDLENASGTERRQILQLGSAVTFSIVASTINWCIASILLVGNGSNWAMNILPIFITMLVAIPVFLSFNRNLIFYSDTHAESKPVYNYTGNKKESIHTLSYLRGLLVLIVCGFNIAMFKGSLGGIFFIIVLGIFELYPMLLKRQIGQTILGRRVQAKMYYQHQRGKLKKEQYSKRLEQFERELNEISAWDDSPDPDTEPNSVTSTRPSSGCASSHAAYDNVRSIK